MKYRFLNKIAFVLFLPALVWGQGTYYNSINPTTASFITDLENRIRSPYTHVSYAQYDETNVANFASRDTSGGRKVVTCVYSGENYIYTGTFAWLPFSREHTFCHSWMPSNPADSPERDEYSDQHHLFPTNQNNANAVRSNHPLGIVTNISSQYLQSKFGTNSIGQTVFEPRDSHKGDAARAILYMCLRYDGIGGNVWNFNNLNNTILPGQPQPEAPQNLQTLLDWHKQDPPSKWEVDRNNYIQSIQGNRNPFSDHPEYVNYINFNDLTKLNPSYSTEPSNQPTGISDSSITDSSFTISWTSAVSGSQSPSGYLIEIYNSNDYFIPIDGSSYSDDTNISDSKGLVNVSAATTSYTFSGLTAGTTYYIRLYSYNGSSSSINYKIDGTVITSTAATTGGVVPILADEPTNYPNGYNTPTITSNSIKITWSDPSGAVLPTGYLLEANTSNSFTDPTNGNEYTDQPNLASGPVQVNIPYGSGQYTFTGLPSSTSYYFKLYPYNGNTVSRYYKTVSYPSALDGNYSTIVGSPASGATDLFISEYIEGSSNNKAIEIYNGTASSINLTSGAYKIEIYFNGLATLGNTINLTGSIASGGVYVIGNSSASASITGISNLVSGSLNFNGDDAVVLKKGTTVLDVIGQVGTDPGTEWGSGLQSTADNSIIRKSSVSSGDTNPSNVFDPSIEWDGYATDTFSDLGSHTATLLPVELISFTASLRQKNVIVQWSTATEVNNVGFELQRSAIGQQLTVEKKDWNTVAFIEGNGTTNVRKEYFFTDKNVNPGKYSYRLKQIDRDGTFEYSQEIEVAISPIPQMLTLMQNYPNPFNPTTLISYQLSTNGLTTLKVYDVVGREVATLVNEVKETGYYSATFDAKNLVSGIYFAKLQSGGKMQLKKMLLIR